MTAFWDGLCKWWNGEYNRPADDGPFGAIAPVVPDPFVTLMVPILVEEGGNKLTNDPDDSGGVTIWGITEDVATASGYVGPMGLMTQVQALAIYRSNFWSGPGFDKLYLLVPSVAVYMLGIGINIGPDTVVDFLQRSLNVLNLSGTLYQDLKVDGKIGPATLTAVGGYLAVRQGAGGCLVLLGMVRALAVSHYIELAEQYPIDEKFEYGWMHNRALSLA